MVLSIAFLVYAGRHDWITRSSNIQRKKNPSLINLIRLQSTLIPGCFTEPPAREGGVMVVVVVGEEGVSCCDFSDILLELWGWSTTGSAARRFVQPFNVLLGAASLWFTSLNVRLQTAVITDGESCGDLALKRSSVYEGRSGRSGDLHVRVNPEWQPGLSHFSTLESRPSILPRSLFPSGPNSPRFP